MNLGELLLFITETALSNTQIVSVQTGNVFEIAAKKDKYPALWIELPALIDYNLESRKNFTFALNFLSLCKYDDIQDIINKTSDMEVCADSVLMALDESNECIMEDITGLTLRNFSDDDLVGVRVELTFITSRVCDWQSNFVKPIE